ncbi:GIN domain-containing protein [Chondrinema litorale]|uniref:GIN domain-containing protein n=1 Tax=Chondrinema litorale TaxID=2994555 RepID=UPI002542F890|nr:DUF2807 domain-containing protein [Chondrinema litorale]UZR92512.1 DUF2807 domain-containing protein [Chondrinema litorale]
MKKNISINVGGIIFHIEEDGYETLKDYLSSINRYFSNYEDSSEIIVDIESRIAEIFLSKLSEHKQVITLEDVNSLIATMGRVSDFEAAEEIIDESYGAAAGFQHQDTATKAQKSVKQGTGKEHYEEKRGFTEKAFLRDEKRKLIGGVCSGIAHYFNLDPLWIRMLFLLPVFDIFITFIAPWFVFAVYVAIWIFIPGSEDLEEDEKVRRLFRDGENAVLGGVASGVGSFFGIDSSLVRLFFVLSSIFGGVGFVIYLIIWFITPEAKSITERMQMKGEPITLSNIEKKIKDSLNFDEDEEESLLAKILLFPFRLISKIIDNVGGDLGPIAKVLFTIVSVFIGILLVIISMGTTIGLVSSLAIFYGYSGTAHEIMIDNQIPLEMIQNSIPPVGVFFAFVSIWVPFIFVGILGTCLIARKMVVKPVLNWGLLGIWIIGLIGAGVTVPLFLTELQASGSFKETSIYEVPNERLNISLNDNSRNDEFHLVNLSISGHDKDEVELVQRIESRGKTRQYAIENAKNILYKYKVDEANLSFDPSFELKEDAPFRGQTIDLMLYIPYGKEFTLAENIESILRESSLEASGYSFNNLGDRNIWKFDEEKGLNCITCTPDEKTDFGDERDIVDFNFREGEFNKLQVTGAFDVEIIPGDKYSVVARGENKNLQNLKVNVKDNTLIVRHKENNDLTNRSNEILRITINVPELNEIYAEGALKCEILNLSSSKMRLKLVGAVSCDADLDAENLSIEVTGASNLNLKGRSELLNLGVMGTSEVDANDFEAESINVEALGLSSAFINASEHLSINASETSSVKYKGTPESLHINEIKENNNHQFNF